MHDENDISINLHVNILKTVYIKGLIIRSILEKGWWWIIVKGIKRLKKLKKKLRKYSIQCYIEFVWVGSSGLKKFWIDMDLFIHFICYPFPVYRSAALIEIFG